MRASTLIVLLVLSAAGCGQTMSETAPVGPASESQPTAAEAPTGTLGFDGIGSAQRGMSVAEVEELFGEPTRSETALDCELSGTNAREQTVLTYETPEGLVSLSFYPEGLSSYRSESTALETAQGISVGDTYGALADATGDELEPIDLGLRATPERGLWSVEEGPTARMTYEIEDGEIVRILGGDTIICE